MPATTTAEELRVGSESVHIHVTSAESGGALLVAEVHMPAGGGPPGLHRHAPAEVYRVESGTLAFYADDGTGEVRRRESGPGEVVHIPGGAAHTIRNESAEEARALAVFSPGEQMEGFMRAAAALAANEPPAMDDVLDLARRHGVEMTGPLPDRG